MSDKHYIPASGVMGLETSPEMEAYSKVIVHAGKTTNDQGEEVELVYEAGDDTGRTLEVNVPLLTYRNGQTITDAGQALARDILNRVNGYRYKPFTASGASLDPAAELGDAVNVAGTFSIVAAQKNDFDVLVAEDVEAPSDGDVEHEYPYEASETRQIAREINRIGARFTVQIDSITAEVQGVQADIGTINTSLSVMNGKIDSKITSDQAETLIGQEIGTITLSAVAGSNQSIVTITANGVEVDSAIVKFSNIVADTIVANATISSPNIVGGKFGNSDNSAYVAMSPTGFADFGIYYANDTPKFRISDTEGPGSSLYFIYETTPIAMAGSGGVTFLKDLTVREEFSLTSGYGYGSTLPSASTAKTGQVFFVI